MPSELHGFGWVRRGWVLSLFLVGLTTPIAGADPLLPGPRLSFSTFFGGDSTDRPQDLAVDDRGNVYVAGSTSSSALPGGAVRRPGYHDLMEGFVTRIDPLHGRVVFTTFLGGSRIDYATSVAVAPDGSLFVVGSTDSPDFPAVPGVPVPAALGQQDAYVVKLDPTGRVLFARRLGGSGSDSLWRVRVGSDGVPWVAGQFASPDFPGPFRGPASQRPGSEWPVSVGRIDPATGDLLWVLQINGFDGQFVTDLALDAFGNAYATGGTTSTDLPTTPGAAQPDYGGQGSNNLGDAWVAKITPAGRLAYLTYAGGPGDEYAMAVAVDRAGHAYIAGFTYSAFFPVVNARQPYHAGGIFDAFVVKLAPDGSSFLYSTYFGGTSGDDGFGLAVDPYGELILTGHSHSDDLPLASPFQAQRYVDPELWESEWQGDAFVARFSGDGELLSSSYLGGEGLDFGWRVVAGPWNRVWLLGVTISERFPVVAPIQPRITNTGSYEVFVAAIDEPRRHLPALTLGGGRFRVEAVWFDPYNGSSGVGRPAPLTADTGTFWFFHPDNAEVVVKVLDGRSLNGHSWLFYGGLSTVEYWLRVTDLATGASRSYHNPPFVQASHADVAALPAGDAEWVPAAAGQTPARLDAPSTVGRLRQGRFEISIDWTDPRTGNQGSGRLQALSEDTALAWFFRADNVELLVKVLDGRPVNGYFWVFYASLTDLETTLRVRDTITGSERAYHKPGRVLRSGADTLAFTP